MIYIKKGKIKVTVISAEGKEAVVALLGADEFLGEGCLIGQPKRLATASAMTDCTYECGEDRDPESSSGGARIFANVCFAYPGPQCPGRGRPGRPTF